MPITQPVGYTLGDLCEWSTQEHSPSGRFRTVIISIGPNNEMVRRLELPETEAVFLCNLMKYNREGRTESAHGWKSPKQWLLEVAARLADPTRWLDEGGKYLNIRFDSRNGFANVHKDEPGQPIANLKETQ